MIPGQFIPNNPMTVSMWVRLENPSIPFGQGFSKYPVLSGQGHGFNDWNFHLILQGNGKDISPLLEVMNSSGIFGEYGTWNLFSHDNGIGDAMNWHHIAIAVENSTTATLYLDGAKVTWGPAENGFQRSPSELFYLGWAPRNQGLGGSLDDVRIYNRALSETEILQLNKFETMFNAVPVAVADALARSDSTRVTKVSLATLLANDTDPENDTLSITAVGSALPAGSTVSISGAFAVYVAPGNAAGDGSFTYTLSDGTSSVTGVVTVTQTTSSTTAGAPNAVSLVQSVNDYVVKFLGVPGRTYGVQYTTDTSPPYVWREFVTPVSRVAPASGVMSYTDVSPSDPMRLYRAVLLP